MRLDFKFVGCRINGNELWDADTDIIHGLLEYNVNTNKWFSFTYGTFVEHSSVTYDHLTIERNQLKELQIQQAKDYYR